MKSKNYEIDLYENIEDNRILNYITSNYNYAYILHDKDVEETGEIKKNHYHVMIQFQNEKHLSALAKELNVEEYRIQKIKRWRSAIRYLTHIDYKQKAQYDFEEIETNITGLQKYFREDKEIENMSKILNFIYSVDRFLYIHEVLEFTLNNNCYADYRRAGNQIIKVIEEHNKLFLEKNKIDECKRSKQKNKNNKF